MRKIKIIRCETIEFKEGLEITKCFDSDNNVYWKRSNDEVWRSESSIGTATGNGLSIEECYCHMFRTFDIPDRLLK